MSKINKQLSGLISALLIIACLLVNNVNGGLVEENEESLPVKASRLRSINVPYLDFKGKRHGNGELIVFDVIADDVREIFEELFEMSFPINWIETLEYFEGDNERSRATNNTSSFRPSLVPGASKFSLHACGMAIDLNPVQNPVIYKANPEKGILEITPNKGLDYLDRNNLRSGMVTQEVIDVFKRHGFTVWGGNWENPTNYQHFELNRLISEILLNVSNTRGKEFFEFYKNNYHLVDKITDEKVINELIEEMIIQNKQKFMKKFYQNIGKIEEIGQEAFKDLLSARKKSNNKNTSQRK